LKKAKILRMSYDAEGAIKVLQDGLEVERPNRFKQADTLVGISYPLTPTSFLNSCSLYLS
jgi:hypothetical protein